MILHAIIMELLRLSCLAVELVTVVITTLTMIYIDVGLRILHVIGALILFALAAFATLHRCTMLICYACIILLQRSMEFCLLLVSFFYHTVASCVCMVTTITVRATDCLCTLLVDTCECVHDLTNYISPYTHMAYSIVSVCVTKLLETFFWNTNAIAPPETNQQLHVPDPKSLSRTLKYGLVPAVVLTAVILASYVGSFIAWYCAPFFHLDRQPTDDDNWVTESEEDSGDVLRVQPVRQDDDSVAATSGHHSDQAGEPDSEKTPLSCVICRDKPKSVLVLPCRHVCLCVDCAKVVSAARKRRQQRCPLCRSLIQAAMHVYV